MSMFAGSFSFYGNDLTQWRAYAPQHGVSIGFKLEALQRIAMEQHFITGPVRYLGAPFFQEFLDEQLAAMKEGLVTSAVNEKAVREKAVNQLPELVDLLIQSQRSGNLERWIGEVAGLLKHADFRSESEWRCVFVQRMNTIQPQKIIHFRDAGTKVVRFVELDLSQVDLNELFQEAIIGPGAGAEETFQIVTALLRAAGVNATISFPPHAAR